MSASILTFDPTRFFPRPCAVLWSPGKTKTGERLWFIDYLPFEHEGGGNFGLWSGTDYGAALHEMGELNREGIAVHEMTGGLL